MKAAPIEQEEQAKQKKQQTGKKDKSAPKQEGGDAGLNADMSKVKV